jgi:hypothetical protein
MAFGLVHRSIDALAIWTEDRIDRGPEACRLAGPEPLDCFGPLPPLPDPPTTPGAWRAPSPRPERAGDLMRVDVTPARTSRRGTIILVPPWKIASPELVSGYSRLLTGAGYDVWLVCPPHHLDRAAAGRRSGEAFVSLELARLRQVFEQFVLEVRVCVALAARHGPVGLVGLSLGGLAGGFAATASEQLAFAALIAPAHLALVMTESGIGRRYRRLAARAGSPWPEPHALTSALAPFDPRTRAVTARGVFIAGGVHDRVVPVAAQIGLARAWGVTPRLYQRGHISLLFLCRALRRDLLGFVDGALRGSRDTKSVAVAAALPMKSSA